MVNRDCPHRRAPARARRMPTGPLLGSDPPEYQESHHGRYKTVWGPQREDGEDSGASRVGYCEDAHAGERDGGLYKVGTVSL